MTREFVLKQLSIVFIFFALAAQAAFAQTTAFNFQGRLNDGANPANGNVELQFKLFDALTGGTQIGAAVSRPNVAVISGIFSTPLDFGAVAFDGSARFVEIAVRPAGSGGAFTILNPRQPILSTPYSIQAQNASKLGGIDASQYVTTATVGGSFIRNATTQQTGNFNINGNGVIGGRLGIGIAAPRSALDVVGVGIISPGGSGGGTMQFSQSNSETAMSFVGGNNRADIRYDGTTLKLLANGGPLSPDSNYGINITNLGNVSLGNATPSNNYRLEVNGETLLTPGGSGGVIAFGTPNSETGMTIASLLGRADLRFDGETLKLAAATSGIPAATNGIAIRTSGNVGIGTANPQSKLTVQTPTNNYGLLQTDGAISFGSFVGGTSAPIGGWFGTKSNHPLYLFTNDGTARLAVATNGNVGIGTTAPQARLDVIGTTRTGILQITGGSDLAEHFEFAETVQPGMVVAIDPLKTGKLIVARGAYNRRVAGIISGANNLAAGMTLPDLKAAKNSLPVALSGRVWVYCDATRNPIQPGDLLTTSATPGHAMKVVNQSKAQGAIIGKAMSELKTGKGLVLVLVSLQ